MRDKLTTILDRSKRTDLQKPLQYRKQKKSELIFWAKKVRLTEILRGQWEACRRKNREDYGQAANESQSSHRNAA